MLRIERYTITSFCKKQITFFYIHSAVELFLSCGAYIIEHEVVLNRH